MKKLGVLLPVLFLMACHSVSLKGNQYVLAGSQFPITLAFDSVGNRFNGKAVNNYFGSYQITGNQIEFSQTGATMMMGAPEEMKVESLYFKNLSQVRSYRLNGNELILQLADGQEMRFQKTKIEN